MEACNPPAFNRAVPAGIRARYFSARAQVNAGHHQPLFRPACLKSPLLDRRSGTVALPPAGVRSPLLGFPGAPTSGRVAFQRLAYAPLPNIRFKPFASLTGTAKRCAFACPLT